MIKDIAELMRSVAALLWPILVFVLVLLFRAQLRDVISRVRRGKLFGQEFELNDSLNRLNEKATQAASEIPLSLMKDASPKVDESAADEEILRLAAQSPRAALITLAARIEKETRKLLAVTGHLSGMTNPSFTEGLAKVQGSMGLPTHLTSTIKLFWELRNRIVHGHAANDKDVLRAIDSGMTILNALRAVPHEINVVYHPGVTVYSDQDAKQEMLGVKGVILETTNPGEISKSFKIYPTTRSHFKKGMKVAWEWSFNRTFGKAWYLHPETGAVTLAWEAATEFIGRNLEDV